MIRPNIDRGSSTCLSPSTHTVYIIKNDAVAGWAATMYGHCIETWSWLTHIEGSRQLIYSHAYIRSYIISVERYRRNASVDGVQRFRYLLELCHSENFSHIHSRLVKVILAIETVTLIIVNYTKRRWFLLCSRSSTFRHVYHPTQHSYLLTFSKPPTLCRWYSIFSPSILVTLTQVSPTSRLLCNSFPPRCLLTFLLLLLTLLRLNFSLLVSNSNFLK